MKIKSGGRVYNGLPSKLMNAIYDQLKARIDNFPSAKLPEWDILSLYLARACGVVENSFTNELKREITELQDKLAKKDKNLLEIKKHWVQFKKADNELIATLKAQLQSQGSTEERIKLLELVNRLQDEIGKLKSKKTLPCSHLAFKQTNGAFTELFIDGEEWVKKGKSQKVSVEEVLNTIQEYKENHGNWTDEAVAKAIAKQFGRKK